jgi:8-oxo-dGTP diphosphatase
MTRRISVRGIVLHEGKLLCVRLKAYNGSIRKQITDYWCLPGGGLEEGEALLNGIEREMIEETGIKPAIGNLLYVQQFTHGDKEFLEFFFHITNSRDYLAIDLSKSSHGLEEIEEVGFVDPAETYILPEFLSKEHLDEQAVAGAVKVISLL